MNTGIVRIFNTFGPRMRFADGRAIPSFIRQALLDEPDTMAGDGAPTRSISATPYEISTLDQPRWIVGWSVPTPHRPHRAPGRRPHGATTRHRRGPRPELGWEPQVSIEEELKRTTAWFRDHPQPVRI